MDEDERGCRAAARRCALQVALAAAGAAALSTAACRRRRAGAGDAQEPGDDQRRRRRRQPRADAGRDRGLSRRRIRTCVAKFNFTKAPAPELPGKLKAMQGAGRSDIDLVLTGTDFLAAGIEQGLLIEAAARLRGEVPEPDGQLPAGRGARCRSSRRTRASPSRSCRPARCSSTTRPRSSRCRRRRRNCSRGARRIRTG